MNKTERQRNAPSSILQPGDLCCVVDGDGPPPLPLSPVQAQARAQRLAEQYRIDARWITEQVRREARKP